MHLNNAMKSDIFLPIASESYFGRSIDNWQNPYIASFIELQKGVTPEQLTIPIQDLVKRNTDGEFSASYTPDLKPLKSYFLDDNMGAVRKMITTLLWIAGFVLLMAIINFINITISQNITRLKEIGIRKMMGSSRPQINPKRLIKLSYLRFMILRQAILILFFNIAIFFTAALSFGFDYLILGLLIALLIHPVNCLPDLPARL